MFFNLWGSVSSFENGPLIIPGTHSGLLGGLCKMYVMHIKYFIRAFYGVVWIWDPFVAFIKSSLLNESVRWPSHSPMDGLSSVMIEFFMSFSAEVKWESEHTGRPDCSCLSFSKQSFKKNILPYEAFPAKTLFSTWLLSLCLLWPSLCFRIFSFSKS